MKKFSKMAAQGDIVLVRVKELPKGLEIVKSEKNRCVVSHSETGHDHFVDATGVSMFQEPNNPFICYLQVAPIGGADLIHARPFDTHETLHLEQGTYKIHRQREYTPSGWRRVED